jgi:hypothetical protein
MSSHWQPMSGLRRRSGGCKLQPNPQAVSRQRPGTGRIHPDRCR